MHEYRINQIAGAAKQPLKPDAEQKQPGDAEQKHMTYKNHRIIVCDIQETGYFETSQIEPELLLGDFIYFFHPEVLTGEYADYQPKYYHLMGSTSTVSPK